ncbi:hypothetical protein McanCB56680_006265 [Microsporum canis]
MALSPCNRVKPFASVEHIKVRKEALADMAFKISCPPDVSPSSRVVAVCGVTDHEGQASPSDDDCISDFYLFHHLLSPKSAIAKNQVWLTVENPEDLVRKYGEYAHGDPRKERRVTLDKDTLGNMKNIQVVPRPDLLDRFLSTLRKQALVAAERQEQLIVFIFSHGDIDTYGVHLGSLTENPNKYHLLLMRDFTHVIPKETKVTLFTASCYSGGWLAQTNANTARFLNGITGSRAETETLSSSFSRSVGRACGSSIAWAILWSVMEIEEEGEDRMDVLTHPTYMDLAYSILESISNIHSEQYIHFSAENDEWETRCGKRKGFPLKYFKERWETLRIISPSDTNSPELGSSRWITFQSSIDRKLRHRAVEYLSSKPGADNISNNVWIHSRLRRYLQGELQLDEQGTLDLLNLVLYRLSLLQGADEYIQIMGIEAPSIKEFEVDQWKVEWEKKEKRDDLFRYILQARLFDPPMIGLYYSKPAVFLAIALVETCQSRKEAEDKVSLALDAKFLRMENIIAQVPAEQVIDDAQVTKDGKTFFQEMKKLGHKVRFKGLEGDSPSRL